MPRSCDIVTSLLYSRAATRPNKTRYPVVASSGAICRVLASGVIEERFEFCVSKSTVMRINRSLLFSFLG